MCLANLLGDDKRWKNAKNWRIFVAVIPFLALNVALVLEQLLMGAQVDEKIISSYLLRLASSAGCLLWSIKTIRQWCGASGRTATDARDQILVLGTPYVPKTASLNYK